MRYIIGCLVVLWISLTTVFSQSEFSNPTIQIGVVCADLDKSLEFYTQVIGMTQTGEFSVGDDFAKRSGLSNGVPFDVKVLRLEDSQTATQWKLMSFGTKASHPYPEYIQDDTGMQYITIFVNDLTPFVERIKKHKVKFLGETPVVLNEKNHFVFIQDPDGNFIELIGPMK